MIDGRTGFRQRSGSFADEDFPRADPGPDRDAAGDDALAAAAARNTASCLHKANGSAMA